MERPVVPTDTSVRWRIVIAVFFVSFATIGWQLGVMRCLLITRYHHFAFLIISCALLGFGGSGTVLSLWRRWFAGKSDSLFRWGTLAFAVSLPACFRLGAMLPVEVYFSPLRFGSIAAWWTVFWLLHCVPFLLAGMLIGLALMTAGRHVHVVYAANLVGSASGALGAILLLWVFPANALAIPLSLSVVGSALVLVRRVRFPFGGLYRIIAGTASLFLVGAHFVGADRVFPLTIDQYKFLAYVQRLVRQGSAERVTTLHGPRGRVELFRGPHFHTLLSLSSKSTPPPMDMLIRDGFLIGSILSLRNVDQARFLEETLSSLPYKLVHPSKVLVLGDAGGIYAWLARLSGADSIVMVEPDKNVVEVLRSHSSRVLEDARIRVVIMEPRAFLDTTKMKFDIIHLAALEGFAAGSGGIGSLREDYLATVEGFGKCLDALTPRGVAGVVRGIQEPARDNIKIPATWIEALESRGVRNAGKHILMARDELSMATLVSRSPWSLEAVESFRKSCAAMSWETEWFPGISPGQTNTVHVLPGPKGSSVSWYHYAMRQILAGNREDFYRNWIIQVEPATDDRPFFHDFFRWASISRLRQAFGPLWPTRSEMGFLVLVMAAIWTSAVAVALLPGPLMILRREPEGPSGFALLVTVAFFGALGTGFMFLEMSYIQMYSRFLGDPVLAAGLVIGGFLFFAGVGSMAQPYVTNRVPGAVVAVASAIALTILLEACAIPRIFDCAAGLSQSWKTLLAIGTIAPLAFLLGIPFPWGMSVMHEGAPRAIPIAWAVNGFSSVVSTCGAVLLTMTFGFDALSGAAAGIYAGAGGLAILLVRMVEPSAGTAVES